jgi:transcriptional regulator with XRE-family HTH domain
MRDDATGSGFQRAEDTIGRRIAAARKLRDLTRQQLADRAPCSKSLIAQVESGHKPATQALVAGAARALRVPLGRLTGQPYRDPDERRDRVHRQIPELRRALLAWDLPDEGAVRAAVGGVHGCDGDR